jgi:hypothetical protein
MGIFFMYQFFLLREVLFKKFCIKTTLLSMKKFLFLYLFLTSIINCTAQNKIEFKYDPAGNQIKRSICINCSGRYAISDSIARSSDVISQDLKNDVNSKLSYYPNPVLEELTINWLNDDSTFVSNIEVFSMTGQSLGAFKDLKESQSAVISFSSYPQGIYNLVLYYNDGRKETLKIVKK